MPFHTTRAGLDAQAAQDAAHGRRRRIQVRTQPRPYVLTFHATGTAYPLTSEEAQRLIDEYPIVRATRQRVILAGHNTADARQRTSIQPATRGGGPGFEVTR